MNKPTRVASAGGKPKHFNGTAPNGVPTLVDLVVDGRQVATTFIKIKNASGTNALGVILDGGASGLSIAANGTFELPCQINSLQVAGIGADVSYEIVITY